MMSEFNPIAVSFFIVAVVLAVAPWCLIIYSLGDDNDD